VNGKAPSSRETSGSPAPRPLAVGRYARRLQEEFQRREPVRLIGEVCDLGRSAVQMRFELRDSDGAVPASIWRRDIEGMGLTEEDLREGAMVVVTGHPDYYPGGIHASPSFVFRIDELRLAGEGDLLAQLEALRRQLRLEGLFGLQKQLRRPLLPKTIGVVTSEQGAAGRDLAAALRRRGWAGTLIWAYTPVQDRHAAPAIATAIGDLAARPEVDVIVATRGGGSRSDLWTFCDESLCRTVAALRVPVIAAVGHERDSTLIDDVAAEACSTPTHAAEAAVPLECNAARRNLLHSAVALGRASDAAVGKRGAGATAQRVSRLSRAAAVTMRRRRRELLHLAMALRAHDPERLHKRGYALVEGPDGEPVRSGEAARAAARVSLRFSDSRVAATIDSVEGGSLEGGAASAGSESGGGTATAGGES
jgi:exodeoxyribonuclease VII large subunit